MRSGATEPVNRRTLPWRRALPSSLRLRSRRKNVAELVFYFGGAGVKISRRAGSGFGLGFGAFFASFLPLSLLPMTDSLPQFAFIGKDDERKQLSVFSLQFSVGLLVAARVDGFLSSVAGIEDMVRCR